MKRLAVITTSLLLALSAFAGSAAVKTASADGGSQTRYPADGEFKKELTFSDLNDYDVEDGTFFFLDGEKTLKWENGELSEAPREAFSEPKDEVTIGSYTFRLLDTTLKVADYGNDSVSNIGDGYSLLKYFGETAYAVKDDVLYSLNGADEPTAIVLEYVDYTVADGIDIGNTAEALKGGYTLKFVKVKAGSFMTEVDLTALDREKFVSDGETKTVNTKIAESDFTALLLCYTGNAAVIAVGGTADGTSYIVLNDPSVIEELPQVTADACKSEVDFTSATIIGDRIYVSPFTVSGTTLLADAAATIVTVKYKIEYEGVLNSAYYEVEFTDADGNVKTGYVAEGFLTKFIIEDNKPPETVPDPEHSEKTNVTSVLLILAVVALVLIAVGYVVYTSTSGKKGKKKKNDPDPRPEKAEEKE